MNVSLETLIRRIRSRGVRLQIENRAIHRFHEYGFRKKHLEILGNTNTADGDLWDGLVFGYSDWDYDYGTEFRSNILVGIIFIADGLATVTLIVKQCYIFY